MIKIDDPATVSLFAIFLIGSTEVLARGSEVDEMLGVSVLLDDEQVDVPEDVDVMLLVVEVVALVKKLVLALAK